MTDRDALRDALAEALIKEDHARHSPGTTTAYRAWAARILAHPAVAAALAGSGPEAGLDVAYRERNALVAALIRVGGYPAQVVMAPDTEGWFIVYAETPQGQVSWHISPDDMDLFSDWPVAFGTRKSPWDGHTTEEKYRRVTALAATPTASPTEDGLYNQVMQDPLVVAWRSFSDRFMDPAYRDDPERHHIREAFAAGWDARTASPTAGGLDGCTLPCGHEGTHMAVRYDSGRAALQSEATATGERE